MSYFLLAKVVQVMCGCNLLPQVPHSCFTYIQLVSAGVSPNIGGGGFLLAIFSSDVTITCIGVKEYIYVYIAISAYKKENVVANHSLILCKQGNSCLIQLTLVVFALSHEISTKDTVSASVR